MISEKDLKRLKLMSVGPIERLSEIFDLYDKEDKKGKSAALIEIFNYGYMMGKREERVKRKAYS